MEEKEAGERVGDRRRVIWTKVQMKHCLEEQEQGQEHRQRQEQEQEKEQEQGQEKEKEQEGVMVE